MKTKFIFQAPFLLIIASVSMSFYLHKGGVDKRGGHIDTKDNTYHYHHGCEAHQHPEGTCKFDFKNCERSNPKEIAHDHDYRIEND